MLVKSQDLPLVDHRFNAHIVWMIDEPMVPGRLYNIKLGPTFTAGSVQRIEHRIDVNTLEQDKAEQLALNEIGLCEVSLNQPVAFDPYPRNRLTGAFIVIDRLTNVTVGAGMIAGAAQGGSENLEPVSTEERQRRLAQKPLLLGTLGAQALPLAQALERQLFDLGKTVVLLDGQNLPDLEERRRTAELLLTYGLVVIATDLGDDVASLAVRAESPDQVAIQAREAIARLQQKQAL